MLLPVVNSSGKEIKLKFWLIYRQTSIEKRDIVLHNPPKAEAIERSLFPLLNCAATTLYFIEAKSNSLVVNSLSIGKELPYPAADPKGF